MGERSRADQLLQKGQVSFLSPPEYLEIISSFYPRATNYDENNSASLEWVSSMGFIMATDVLSTPPASGTLIVYDKAFMTQNKKKFKRDGHIWKTKSRGASSGPIKGGTREDSVRLTVPCVETGTDRKLYGAYAHHAEIDFHRRTYHEVGCVKGPKFDEIHVVHYLSGSKSTSDNSKSPSNGPSRSSMGSGEETYVTGEAVRDMEVDEMLGSIDMMFDIGSNCLQQNDSVEFNDSTVSDEAFWENIHLNASEQQNVPQVKHSAIRHGMLQSREAPMHSFHSESDQSFNQRQSQPKSDRSPANLNSSTNGINIPHSSYESSSCFSSFHIMQDAHISDKNQCGTSPTSSNGSFNGSFSNQSSSFTGPSAIPLDNRNFSPQASIQDNQMNSTESLSSLPDSRSSCTVNIIDVSPDWVDCIGGNKLLLVLNSKLNQPKSACEWVLQCGFSSSVDQGDQNINDYDQHSDLYVNNWRWVEAEMLGDSVVRCHVPPHPPGPVKVVVAAYFATTYHRRELLAVAMNAGRIPHVMLTYRSLWRSSASSSCSSQKNISKLSDSIGQITPMHAKSNLPLLPTPLPAFNGKRFSKQTSDGADRESKIRIVHKLEKVEHTLHASTQQHPPETQSNASSSSSSSASYTTVDGSEESQVDNKKYMDGVNNRSSERTNNGKDGSSEGYRGADGGYDALVGLLDDDALTNISDQELEEVLEGMLMRVVDQMVQLAASDDDLRGELNAPDKNGMCLLHYAGLYNILSLVPVLLQYGAWIDATAGKQLQTPLHLASCAGHAAVVGSLLLYGADPFCKDALGHDPAAAAAYHGHSDAASLVLAAQNTRRKAQQWNRMNDEVNENTNFMPSSSPDRGDTHNGLTQQNVAMLQDAFTTLSLKDKCLIRSGVAMLEQVGYDEDDIFHSESADEGVESEVASVITDSDKESLDTAIAMMGPEERVELEKEARVLQTNMKAWMMRRNYKSMRESVRKLQGLWRENRPHKSNTPSDTTSTSSAPSSSSSSNMSILNGNLLVSIDERKEMSQGLPLSPKVLPSSPINNTSGGFTLNVNGGGESVNHQMSNEMSDTLEQDVELSARTKIQAISRGMLARKNFGRIKQETLAMIVIQRTLLRRKKGLV